MVRESQNCPAVAPVPWKAGTATLMRISLVAMWAALFAAATTHVSARDAEFDVVITSNIMVPMRDGVRLATDIYRPARGNVAVDGRYPVILTRTPYNKSVNPIVRLDEIGRYFAARGYVFVAQDTRGRYASE